MEPNRSSLEMNMPSPESLPTVPTPETTPGSNPEFPMPSPERGQESGERGAEQSAQAQAAVAAQPIPITLPTPMPTTADDTQSATAADDLPGVAGDEDLIEKEWVDKAKQIISQTVGDPAQREKEVNRLQSDYLKKRYGKELGASTE